MVEIVNFDNLNNDAYEHDDVVLMGRSKKEFLKNKKSNKSCIFKYPKKCTKTGKITTEHVSEKCASNIAKCIGIECAKVDIGIFKKEIGSVSYMVHDDGDELEHGTSVIGKIYPEYKLDNHFDNKTGKYYSIDMIEESLRAVGTFNRTGLLNAFYKMLVFDFLIGNTDRHSDNWALIKSTYTFSPLYDNGSSLCAYVNDDNLDISIYLKDKQRYNALIDTSSKSKIRINSYRKGLPKHSEVIRYLKTNGKLPLDMINRINYYITVGWIDSVLNEYPDNIISDAKKGLIKMYLLGKIELLNNIIKED